MSVDPGPGSRGATRSELLGEGALVFLATGVSNALVFAGFIVAGRVLGPDEYGTVAAMFGVVIVLTIPSLALQTLVAREAASAIAGGAGAPALATVHHRRRRQALVLGGGMAIAGAALAPLVAESLGLGSAWPLVFTAAAALPIIVMAEGRGLQQGRQRFAALGANLLAEGGVRLVATVAVLGAGFGATGVTAAPLVGTACAAGLALWSARDLPPAVGGAVAPPVARAGLSLVLFAGFATVTNLDVVAANRVLDDVAAGEYGAAALFGRVVLLAPLAVGVVLVPKVIDADESGRPTRRLLWVAIGAVGATSGLLALAGLLAPAAVRALSVGGGFAGADPVIRLYGLAMLGFALVLVIALYDIALSRPVAAWACLVAVPIQATALLLAPARGTALAAVLLATACALVAIGLAEALAAGRLRPVGARSR